MKKIWFLSIIVSYSFTLPIYIRYNHHNPTIFQEHHPISLNQEETTLIDIFNESNAYNYIEQQLNFGYRIPGTTESRNCLNWISSEMEKYTNNYLINFTIKDVKCNHLISKINSNSTNITIFAAHYDSRAVAEKDPDESKKNLPIQGANDGGSGVAVLMELARDITLLNISLNCDIWFLFIDAEDQGSSLGTSGIDGWNWCEGSKWLANDMEENPQKYFLENQSIDSINAFILLDMVGGNNLKFVRESHSSIELMDQIYEIGNNLGYSDVFPLQGSTYLVTDDHVYFANKGVATVDLIIKFGDPDNGWPYHHTSSDTLENISEESLSITGTTIIYYIWTYLNKNSADYPPNYSNNSKLSQYLILIGISFPIGILIIVELKKKKKIQI